MTAQPIRTAYRERLARGEIAPDVAQAQAVEALARLEGDLNARSEPGFSLPFLTRRREAPRGVYLYGPLGRCKSMLLDLFFDSAPMAAKRRVHFHAFMAEVHGGIDAWRKGDAAARKAAFGTAKGDDPIAPVAGHIAQGARLLCFDELHVTDIADAMILGRLIEALFALGVVMVATSNRAPQALYENGINRQLFLPFIELLQARMEVVRVGGPKDFRLERLTGRTVYFEPINPATRAPSTPCGGACWRAPRKPARRSRSWGAGCGFPIRSAVICGLPSPACAGWRWARRIIWPSPSASTPCSWRAFRGWDPRTATRRRGS